MLTLVGRVDTSTFHFKIDLEEKKLTDTYLSDSTLVSISMDYFENGDMVECFKPQTIRKTNAAGNLIWEKTIPLSEFTLRNVAVDTAENVYLCGYQREDNRRIANLIAWDKDGAQLWQNNFDPVGDDIPFLWFYTIINKIRTTSDGGIIAVGTDGTSSDGPVSDVFACKHNVNGDLIWTMNYNIIGEGDEAYGILLDEEDIVITGIAGESDVAGVARGFTLKIKDLSYIVEDSIMMDTMTYINNPFVSKSAPKFYPNPGKSYIQINHDLLQLENFTIQILNTKGQILSEHSNNKIISVHQLSAGKYVIRVKSNHFTFSTIWIKAE